MPMCLCMRNSRRSEKHLSTHVMEVVLSLSGFLLWELNGHQLFGTLIWECQYTFRLPLLSGQRNGTISTSPVPSQQRFSSTWMICRNVWWRIIVRLKLFDQRCKRHSSMRLSLLWNRLCKILRINSGKSPIETRLHLIKPMPGLNGWNAPPHLPFPHQEKMLPTGGCTLLL